MCGILKNQALWKDPEKNFYTNATSTEKWIMLQINLKRKFKKIPLYLKFMEKPPPKGIMQKSNRGFWEKVSPPEFKIFFLQKRTDGDQI